MKKLVKLALAGAMAFSLVGCGKSSSSSESSSEGLNVWHDYQTTANEMDTWTIQYSQGQAVLMVLTNCIDGLLTNDTEGKIVSNFASDWEANEDKTEWTFHLQEGVKWVDYNQEEKDEVTAQDWITGLEYVLNYAKNSGANSSMAREMIKGADDYYQMTLEEYNETGAVSEETEAKFLDMVGISAPDDYTLVYTMVSPKPYFDSLACYATLYPLPQGAIDEYGDKYGTDNTTIWYDGPYVISEFTANNSKKFVQNKTWWDAANHKRFDEIDISMIESAAQAYTLFQSGEIDRVELTEDNLNEIYKEGESNPYYQYLVEMKPTKFAYFMAFNYNAKNEDGSDYVEWNTAVANLNFRKALYYGLDWTDYLKRINTINPGNCVNDVYTYDGLVYTSDGTDYTDLVRANLPQDELSTPAPDATHGRYDPEKAADYLATAKEELEAAGVSLPVTYYYYYKAGDSAAADTAAVFKQMVEEQMGDLMVVDISRTYSESSSSEIIKPELFSAIISGWGADYGDPINYLGQVIDDTNAFYNYGRMDLTADVDPLFGEFCDKVAAADAITDLDERYEAFAEAEAMLIENAWIIPLYKSIKWEITRANDYSKIDAVYGIQADRYLDWETTTETAYTTEQYEAFKAASEN